MQEAIAELDDQAAQRLQKCLPRLAQGVANWGGPSGPQGLVIVAATPAGCIVLSAKAWPQFDPVTAAKLDLGEVAKGVAQAIESAPTTEITDRIATGIAVMLGAAGISAQQARAEQIAAAGQPAVTVALFERQSADVTVLVHTTAIARRVVH